VTAPALENVQTSSVSSTSAILEWDQVHEATGYYITVTPKVRGVRNPIKVNFNANLISTKFTFFPDFGAAVRIKRTEE